MPKVCSVCKKKYDDPENHFNPDKRTADKLRGYCKGCESKGEAGAAKAKQSPGKAKGSIIQLDFTGHKDLLESLNQRAREEFRSPEDQIFYSISLVNTDPVEVR